MCVRVMNDLLWTGWVVVRVRARVPVMYTDSIQCLLASHGKMYSVTIKWL